MEFRWPGFCSLKKLSSDEVTELASRVAELTKAGLPLGPGLRALADELSGWRLPGVLRYLADRLDAGDDLLVALESLGSSLPAHLRGLMLAGIRSGRLSEVLEEFVDLQHSQAELRRRICLNLAYPYILVLLMTGLATFMMVMIVPSFEKIFKDFGMALPYMTVWVIEGSHSIRWLSIGVLGLSIVTPLLFWLASPVSWIWPVLYRVPMIGPLLRWGHLSQFARLMGLLLEQRVALPDALRVTAAGLGNANLARGCLGVADDIERGRVLYESMASRVQFPASLIPVVQWGQKTPALADAFRAAAEMFEGRVRSHGTLMEATLLPIMFLVVALFVGFFVIAMFMPLIRLFTYL